MTTEIKRVSQALKWFQRVVTMKRTRKTWHLTAFPRRRVMNTCNFRKSFSRIALLCWNATGLSMSSCAARAQKENLQTFKSTWVVCDTRRLLRGRLNCVHSSATATGSELNMQLHSWWRGSEIIEFRHVHDFQFFSVPSFRTSGKGFYCFPSGIFTNHLEAVNRTERMQRLVDGQGGPRFGLCLPNKHAYTYSGWQEWAFTRLFQFHADFHKSSLPLSFSGFMHIFSSFFRNVFVLECCEE